MIITIRYSHITRPTTIIDRVRRGNGEYREHAAYSGASNFAEAAAWVLTEGPKLKGFRFQCIESIDVEHMPKTIASIRQNGGTDADIAVGHREIY